jgi:Lrp/AsnC family transcriptional regulator, leucine-responsive regulatory protein
MTFETEKLLDETGWRLLQELQQNARLSYSELAQRVVLSAPAVTERIRKMEEAGIITGYHAEVNLVKLGLSVMAMVYLENIGGRSCGHVADELSKMPEVLECHRLTGSDAIILKVAASSLDHLAKLIDNISLYGIPRTSIIRSGSMKRDVITSEALDVEGT